MRSIFFRVLGAVALGASLCPQPVFAARAPLWLWQDDTARVSAIRSPLRVAAYDAEKQVMYASEGGAFSKGAHVWMIDMSSSTRPKLTDLTKAAAKSGISGVDDMVLADPTDLGVAAFPIVVQGIRGPAEKMAAAVYSTQNNAFGKLPSFVPGSLKKGDQVGSLLPVAWGMSIFSTRGDNVFRFDSIQRKLTSKQRSEEAKSMVKADLVVQSPNAKDIQYSVARSSPEKASYFPVVQKQLWYPDGKGSDVPVLLTAYRGAYPGKDKQQTYFFLEDRQGKLADVTTQIPKVMTVSFMAQRGQGVLIAGSSAVNGPVDRLFNVDAVGSGAVSVEDISRSLQSLPRIVWNRAIAGWNGSSMMIIAGKDLVSMKRVQVKRDGAYLSRIAVAHLGQTRDRFFSIVGLPEIGEFRLVGETDSHAPKFVSVKQAESEALLTYTNLETPWGADEVRPITISARSSFPMQSLEVRLNDVLLQTCEFATSKTTSVCTVDVPGSGFVPAQLNWLNVTWKNNQGTVGTEQVFVSGSGTAAGASSNR